jgi:hypothetical protein
MGFQRAWGSVAAPPSCNSGVSAETEPSEAKNPFSGHFVFISNTAASGHHRQMSSTTLV